MFGQIDRRPDQRHLGGAVGQPGGGVGEVEFDRFDADVGIGNLEVTDDAEQQIAPVPTR